MRYYTSRGWYVQLRPGGHHVSLSKRRELLLQGRTAPGSSDVAMTVLATVATAAEAIAVVPPAAPEAARHASDLVIAFRRRSPVGMLVMGSVAQAILLDADSPSSPCGCDGTARGMASRLRSRGAGGDLGSPPAASR